MFDRLRFDSKKFDAPIEDGVAGARVVVAAVSSRRPGAAVAGRKAEATFTLRRGDAGVRHVQ